MKFNLICSIREKFSKKFKIILFSVRINVVGYEEESKEDPYYPILVSKSTDLSNPVVNVLLLGNERTTHFVLIKSRNALLRKKNTRRVKHHCIR